jgi:DNA-binding NtrC family response regulator
LYVSLSNFRIFHQLFLQRPLEISDNNAVMCGKKKTELQHNLADYLPKPVSVSNRFDAMETAEERADRMKEHNTMKAQQAISASGQKSIVRFYRLIQVYGV